MTVDMNARDKIRDIQERRRAVHGIVESADQSIIEYKKRISGIEGLGPAPKFEP